MLFSHDTTLLATGTVDGNIGLWDTSSGECRHTLKGHNELISSLVLSPSNELLVSASADDTMRVWDVGSGECKQVLHTSSALPSAYFSSDSKLLALQDEGNFKILDISSGKCLLTRHIDFEQIAEFSPDFKFLVTGWTEIYLWDISTGQCRELKMPKEDNYIFSSVIFSNDSKLIAAAVAGIVTVWDASSGQSLETFDVKIIDLKFFVLTNSFLHTSIGTIRLSFSLNPGSHDPHHPLRPFFEGYYIDPDREWICWNRKKVLWIPPKYRPKSSIVSGSMMCLIPFSKKVLWLEFDPNGPPLV
ncbi:hypothetical protein N7540_008028 [Penicillium herquei]|nr:hypothetical protein N7540_008028 [Penicillium herquei]